MVRVEGKYLAAKFRDASDFLTALDRQISLRRSTRNKEATMRTSRVRRTSLRREHPSRRVIRRNHLKLKTRAARVSKLQFRRNNIET